MLCFAGRLSPSILRLSLGLRPAPASCRLMSIVRLGPTVVRSRVASRGSALQQKLPQQVRRRSHRHCLFHTMADAFHRLTEAVHLWVADIVFFTPWSAPRATSVTTQLADVGLDVPRQTSSVWAWRRFSCGPSICMMLLIPGNVHGGVRAVVVAATSRVAVVGMAAPQGSLCVNLTARSSLWLVGVEGPPSVGVDLLGRVADFAAKSKFLDWRKAYWFPLGLDLRKGARDSRHGLYLSEGARGSQFLVSTSRGGSPTGQVSVYKSSAEDASPCPAIGSASAASLTATGTGTPGSTAAS